jgi:putative heme-binding domain-containing protein
LLKGAALYAAACTRDNDELRVAGAEALATLARDEAPAILDSLAHPSRVPGERVAATLGLAKFDLPRAAAVAADVLSSDAAARFVEIVFPAFLQRQGGADALASALAAKKPSKSAAEAGLRLMSASGRRNEQLTRALTESAGFSSQDKKMTPQEIGAFVSEVRARGDAKRGAEIFRRVELGCAACHTVNGQGGKVGPDLSALGTAQPVEFIVGAILDPQREIKEGFMSISVLTQDGEEYQGYQVRETQEELALRDALQNKEVRLRRDAIKEKRQNGSVMPNGLADTLTRVEFRDLVRFLSELGRQK